MVEWHLEDVSFRIEALAKALEPTRHYSFENPTGETIKPGELLVDDVTKLVGLLSIQRRELLDQVGAAESIIVTRRTWEERRGGTLRLVAFHWYDNVTNRVVVWPKKEFEAAVKEALK